MSLDRHIPRLAATDEHSHSASVAMEQGDELITTKVICHNSAVLSEVTGVY